MALSMNNALLPKDRMNPFQRIFFSVHYRKIKSNELIQYFM